MEEQIVKGSRSLKQAEQVALVEPPDKQARDKDPCKGGHCAQRRPGLPRKARRAPRHAGRLDAGFHGGRRRGSYLTAWRSASSHTASRQCLTCAASVPPRDAPAHRGTALPLVGIGTGRPLCTRHSAARPRPLSRSCMLDPAAAGRMAPAAVTARKGAAPACGILPRRGGWSGGDRAPPRWLPCRLHRCRSYRTSAERVAARARYHAGIWRWTREAISIFVPNVTAPAPAARSHCMCAAVRRAWGTAPATAPPLAAARGWDPRRGTVIQPWHWHAHRHINASRAVCPWIPLGRRWPASRRFGRAKSCGCGARS